MGDLLKNSKLLKKLGVDSSDQWIIYDENFKKFFNFLSENITDANILTEREVLESDSLKQRGEWLEEDARKLKLQQIEVDNPGLLKYTDDDVDILTEEIATIKEATEEYSGLLECMQTTKHSLNTDLNELEAAVGPLHNAVRDSLAECQGKAKQLEEVERENCQLIEQTGKCFSSQQAPPLFMHQQPLDQYFLKCDIFLQFFTLYLRNNFKIQEYAGFDPNKMYIQQLNAKLEYWQNTMEHYTLAYIKEKAKAKAVQTLIDKTDFHQIHSLSLSDLRRETQDLKLLNENHVGNVSECLLNLLTMYVHGHVEQRIEMVVYENTKQKLERALQRLENTKQLNNIISDALTNAELIWIAIQLDLEKQKNYADSSQRLFGPSLAVQMRVQSMDSLNASYKSICTQFVHEISTLLLPHLGRNIRADEAKSCLYEYEKFGRLLTYTLQSMFNKKSQVHVHEQISELQLVAQTLRPFVYDSPLERPMFKNIRYLIPIFNAVQEHLRLEQALRELRTQFQEAIKQPMEKDTLWRYNKLLWIWFLTEPQRMILAIDEVKKISAKIPALTASNFRPSDGLQRK